MDVALNILAQQAEAAGSIWVEPWWAIVSSVLLFASVALFLVGVFGQGGQVQLSPQRQAAIATGHTDRKTLFENPVFRPVLWSLLSIATRLNWPKAKAFLARQLTAAGSPNYYTPEEYLALAMLSGLVMGVTLESMTFIATGSFSTTAIVSGLLIGIALTVFQIVDKAQKRLREVTRQLPYTLDLVALAMGAGATFTEAVKTVIKDDEKDPLNVELRALLSEIDLGTTRRMALVNMSSRVQLPALQNLVSSVIQAEELGTPIGDVLHDQASVLRLHRSVRAEEMAAKASVRILIPCLLLVIAVILVIFGPFIIRTIKDGIF